MHIDLRALLIITSILLPPLCVILFAGEIYSFLAYERRVSSETLVVESWIADNQLACASREFLQGHYSRILLVGKHGERAAQTLGDLGIKNDAILVLLNKHQSGGNTVSSAYTVTEWVGAQSVEIVSIMIITSSPHAKKTYTAFSKILSKTHPRVDVGIMGCQNQFCHPHLWWQSPQGIYFILRGYMGFIKVRFF